MIYFWLTFEIFHLEKAEFNLYKQYSIKKIPQLAIYRKINKTSCQISLRSLSFVTFIFTGRQICYSNLLMDDCHFQYSTKL
jgi:hypothetical protein